MKRLLVLLVLAMAAWPSPANADQHVLDVGDSHTWITQGVFGYPAAMWEVDSRPGRESTEGLSMLSAGLRGRHDEAVFDLATNDRSQVETFRANLERAWDLIGKHRDLTLVTTWTWSAPGSEAGVNSAIESLAARHPRRVVVAEWDDLAAQHPEWNADGVHFTADGYRARREVVRAAVAHGKF